MTTAYLDSSFFLGIAFDEIGSPGLRRILSGYERILSSDLLLAECFAAGRRETFDENALIAMLRVITLVLPHRSLVREMRTALDEGELRGADLWHVACALLVARGTSSRLAFLTRDRSQWRVAKRLAFETP